MPTGNGMSRRRRVGSSPSGRMQKCSLERARTPKSSTRAEKTILLGLMDSHVHAAGASMYEFDHEIPTMETIVDVLRYIKSRAVVTQKGQWSSLSQVLITRLREQRYPTRAELDEAVPDHEIVE